MNRSVLVGVLAVALGGGAGALFFLMRPSSEPAAPVIVADAPPPEPAAAAAPPPEALPAEAPRPTRRAAVPAPEAAPDAPLAPAEAAPDTGTLHIEADVPGAQVFLDRQFIGAAPVTAQNVKPGTHQLNVSAEGFESIAQSIDVEPGARDIAVRLREVRLDVRLDVVHRHGIGSCRGRLVATPQGIRYETTDRGDQFTSPLLDLDTFQVDYLEKNLRVKLRRGKQFNFTDPEGNADRLFVFHRDVEKARERLRRGDQPAAD